LVHAHAGVEGCFGHLQRVVWTDNRPFNVTEQVRTDLTKPKTMALNCRS
jgi:hypothetical protein